MTYSLGAPLWIVQKKTKKCNFGKAKNQHFCREDFFFQEDRVVTIVGRIIFSKHIIFPATNIFLLVHYFWISKHCPLLKMHIHTPLGILDSASKKKFARLAFWTRQINLGSPFRMYGAFLRLWIKNPDSGTILHHSGIVCFSIWRVGIAGHHWLNHYLHSWLYIYFVMKCVFEQLSIHCIITSHLHGFCKGTKVK